MIDFAKMMERTETNRKVLKEFCDASYANYGSYSYASGYLESLLVQALNSMSKKDREIVLNDLAKQTEKLQKEVDKVAV
jgi:hypothetical protein